ncbi:Phage protein (N4 Gp49/phage Sf6 gene 66) family [uncultured Caudovirales phage]|uniref:Phage protein (N4 Gp49/phage Sf6 gene 66) family n=1 Tax=uncultured Caudovirales phage TaxID=2100421 RepID=A0A6J5KUI3_9CAUD|nr:Phage protein (N4 Gp49/phage Sf6 gene 66) family [uncultured Caudovirales phage]
MQPKLSLEETTARVEANSNANRVSIPSIKARISNVVYRRPFNDTTLSLCVITMVNGFTFVGKSACADPANFDEEVGQRYAYEDAFKQIWSHEAYLIRETLSNQS